MRKVVFGGANSLDNFIARPDHSVDWLMWCKEAADVMKGSWQRFDAVLMGRKTYEVATGGGRGTASSSSTPCYVFSRTLESVGKGATLVQSDAGEFVSELKRKDGKDICLMGGGDLARSLFDAGQIDEIGFNIHPVLLGHGIPLFHPLERQVDLELLECRPFQNGCVYVTYRVKQRDEAAPRTASPQRKKR
jgi:dihydrofolate reductase